MNSHFPIDMLVDVKVPMRDDVNLSADIYLPRGAGAVPTVLMRTPYGNNSEPMIEKGRRLADEGYACVIQDCRGRWDSDGDYYPFVADGADGYDTQEWIAQQEWSDGKIGMAGASYGGAVQWLSASQGSPSLTCIAPRVICCDYFSGLVYPGGALQLSVIMTWGMRTHGRTAQNIDFQNWTEAFRSLPLRDVDRAAGRHQNFWRDWIQHSTYDDFWEQIDDEKRWDRIAMPAFTMGGWYDLYATQTFINFNGLRQRGGSAAARQSKIIVGPWPHALSTSPRTGDVDFGAHSVVDLEALELRWFDYWLRGIDNGIVDEPPLRLFIMGVNEWRDESEWPLARTEWQSWYLSSGGSANSLLGDGVLTTDAPADEPPDQFVYDPDYPVQTNGGNNCCSPHIVAWGPYDQRPVEMRGDVLCYTSEPLERDLEVTGPIEVLLHAATDGRDTDWTAKLVDVAPTGYAVNLCDGILRARYRDSLSDPSLVEPGKVYAYTIDTGVTGNVFRQGHRLRLEISSSNFPRFDRNPNTGNPIGMDAQLRPARQTVHHSRAYPSCIRLPVIPGE